MVLLTMTSSIVEALAILPSEQPEAIDTSDDDDSETSTPSKDTQEPPLDDPEIGKPISHGQIVDLWKKLRAQGDSTYPLEQLLRGATIYTPPPPPKPEPSPEYKALMARLRREEEARAYERLLNPLPNETFHGRFPHAASFAEVNKPTSAADIGDEDVDFNEVHRQVTLIINFLVSIAGVAATLWVVARWWSLPSRLFLTLGGSILVAVAEVAVYSGYVWRMGEARKREGKVREVKEVVESWVVGKDEEDEKTVLIKEKEEGSDTKEFAPSASSSSTTRTKDSVLLDQAWQRDCSIDDKVIEMTPSATASRPRPRARPLRTYGKRTARDESPREPSPKKRRVSTEPTLATEQNSKIDAQPAPLPKTASKETKDGKESRATAIKKGSILNFFKPVPSSSSTAATSPKSDEQQPESTPPSSPPEPPRIQARRKPRILRFRGTSLPLDDTNSAENDTEDGDKTDAEDDKEDDQETRPPLRERRESLSNQESTRPTKDTKTSKKSKPKPSPTVQTTLNLSSQAVFSECKVCNTVWNPLYPDDVKFHNRQHAAVLRAKRKLKESEL
ncbi:hypothetical protein ACJZ2D_011592 [Fusarium nematophilum]